MDFVLNLQRTNILIASLARHHTCNIEKLSSRLSLNCWTKELPLISYSLLKKENFLQIFDKTKWKSLILYSLQNLQNWYRFINIFPISYQFHFEFLVLILKYSYKQGFQELTLDYKAKELKPSWWHSLQGFDVF